MRTLKKCLASMLIMSLMLGMLQSFSFAFAYESVEQEYHGEVTMVEQQIDTLEARGVEITHKTDNTLISNIKNTKNGVITFDISVPAGQTLYYAVELIPNKRTGSIDTAKDASYKNTTSKTVVKTISANVRYASNLYTISANYTTGNSRVKTMYECKKNATSALKTTFRSEKFVWTDELVKQWQAGVAIKATIAIGVQDLLLTAATTYSPALGKLVQLSFSAINVASA